MSGIVIIGNGISGISAAIKSRELTDQQITVISSESKYFFSRTALMYVFMGQMKFEHIKPYEDSFWKQQNIDLVFDKVNKIDPEHSTILTDRGEKITYDQLVIATGSSPRKGKWKGETLKGIFNLYTMSDVNKLHEASHSCDKMVVVGGGLIGIEVCEMFASRGIEVHFLVREPFFMSGTLTTPECEVLERHIRNKGISIHKNETVISFQGDQKGNLKSLQTESGNSFETSLAVVSIGVNPNISFLDGSGIDMNHGILVNEYLETNIRGIYSAGDCTELRSPVNGRRAIEPVWYTGKLMGNIVALNIAGTPTIYNPGVWYNSAKFFDVEYQTYGFVPPINDINHDYFYWEDPQRPRSFNVYYDNSSEVVKGFNFLGIRGDHKKCEIAIREKYTLSEVMESLDSFLFDPEFSKSIPEKILKFYNNLKLINS